MARRQVTLTKIAGIKVNVDWTWLILAFLIVTTLSANFFPVLLPGAAPWAYWTLGTVGALGLFVSILIHEFSHALVGRRYGMSTNEITLFLFGGAAQLEDEPPNAKSEFMMAIAGPLASVALGVVFFTMAFAAEQWNGSPFVLAGLNYLATINLILAAFNMLPGFPLDGGRVLRAALWGWRKDLRWATKVASGFGQFFGFGLMFLGVISFFGGNVLSGVWLFFLGLLLANFARVSYLQLLVKQSLRGRRAETLMNVHPTTVSPNAPVSSLVSEAIYRDDQSVYPVVHGEDFVGCVDMRRLKEIPEDEWPRHPVRELLQECSPDLRIDPDADAEQAFRKMAKTGSSVLMVIKNNRLVGVLSQRGLLRYLSLQQQGPQPS